MPIASNQLILVAGYSYIGCLAGVLWWYATRRSSIARGMLAVLILFPAVLCLYIGVSIFGQSVDSRSEASPEGFLGRPIGIIVGLGVCAVGVIIALFAIRVWVNPLKKPKGD